MKIEKLEIENFRSIKDRVVLNFSAAQQFISFVGPNNAGKSNALRAINLLFNGETEPGVPFSPSVDLYKDSKKQCRVILHLSYSQEDDPKLVAFLTKKMKDEYKNRISVELQGFSTGTTRYHFTNAKGQRGANEELLAFLKEYVNCIYIPAIKDYRSIFDTQMLKKIVSATFQGFGKGIAKSTLIGQHKQDFQQILSGLDSILDETGGFVSKSLSENVPGITKFKFSLPHDNLEDFLGRLDFSIEEENLSQPVTLGAEGSGIQSFTIYTMLRLLHELRPTNTHKKSKYIWLIEEPETFMHHDLQRKAYAKLKKYSEDGPVVITTHSPVFIDKQDFANTFESRKNSGVTTFRSVHIKNIQGVLFGALGVSGKDYFLFNDLNVLVEGETDKKLLVELNKLFMKKGDPDRLDPNRVDIKVCKSASSIQHFFGFYSAFEKYAEFIAIFDRDDAGERARSNLIGDGFDERRLLLIPQSEHKKKSCSIEDLVEKKVWDKILDELDKEGLIEVIAKGGNKTDYRFDNSDRVEVKMRFVELLIRHARKNISAFGKYRELLQSISNAGSPALSPTHKKRPGSKT